MHIVLLKSLNKEIFLKKAKYYEQIIQTPVKHVHFYLQKTFTEINENKNK